ncbi:MAG: acyltransferase family protein [Acidobacteriota bacterium]|jgi:predicted acyltransferase
MLSTRLEALDAFRGLTIFLMVLVNTPGSEQFVYAPLRHADWHGWTLTDAVFPSFVWIVGLALTLSLGRKLEQNVPRPTLVRDILRRTVILFTLGLFLYSFPTFPLETFRILGVLQRIALCYCAASLLFLYLPLRGLLIAAGSLLAAYYAIMTLIPAPGYAPGDLSVEGNLAHYLDKLILGRHNYANTKTWDPEGILSTLPAIATCLLGVLAGHLIKTGFHVDARARKLALIGAGLAASGLMLNTWHPINKKIWTSSFTLFMAGLDFLLFAAMLWLIDHRRVVRPFRPFAILGMNAIAIYMTSELLITLLDQIGGREAIYQNVFLALASPLNASFLFALTYALLHLALAYLLYRRGWFLRV